VKLSSSGPRRIADTVNRQGTKSDDLENSENDSPGLIQRPFGSSDSTIPTKISVGWSSIWLSLRNLCASIVLYHWESTASAIFLPISILPYSPCLAGRFVVCFSL